MNNDEKILKALEAINNRLAGLEQNSATKSDLEALQADVKDLKQGQERIEKRLGNVEQGQAHLATAIEALPTKQDVEVIVDAARTELKADMLMLESKVVKKIQSHTRRITNIEEREGIDNPDKN